MKNIDPLNPDVVPEEKPAVQPTPEPPAQAEAIPEKLAPPAPNPIQAKPPMPPPNPASIYPTPLSPEDRRIKQEQTTQEAGKAAGFSLTQFVIPGIVGLYAIYSLVEIVKNLGAGAAFGSLVAFGYGYGGILTKYIVLEVIFNIFLLIIAVLVSYKVFRGSKLALALLTGPIVLYLQSRLILYIAGLSEYGSFFSSTTTILTMIVEFVLAVSLVLAWTKEKKYYL